MSWMDQVSSLLQQYRGASPPPNVMAEFAKFAERAPASLVSSGLAEAFRSESTPPFADMIALLFGQSDGTQRAGILNHLMAAAGPAVLSGGPLAGLAGGLSAASPTITPEQAQQIRPEAVRQLAEQAVKNDPTVIEKASTYYAQHPALVERLGTDALAVILSHFPERPQALTLGSL